MAPEEARARDALLDMQERLSRDPYDALGLIPSATPADIRNAFLARTKQFHPARFARMSSDVQRLANEVFLQLRAAHDTIARPTTLPRTMTPGPLKPPPAGLPLRSAGTGANPTVRTPTGGTTPLASSSSSLPTAGAARPPTAPNAALRPTSTTVSTRPTPSPGQASTQPLRTDHAVTQPLRTDHVATQPIRTDARTPAPRPNRPDGRTPTSPPVRTGGATTPQPNRPAAVPGPPTRSSSTSIPTAGVAPPAGSAPSGQIPAVGAGAKPAQPVDRELAPILELIAQQQLAAARVALETLCTRQPQSLKYRALLCYVRGRDAQVAQRIDEARVELQDALQLDPDLQLAKSALAELFTRRR